MNKTTLKYFVLLFAVYMWSFHLIILVMKHVYTQMKKSGAISEIEVLSYRKHWKIKQ